MLENELCVFRLTVWREPHQLIFAGIDLEACIIGESRVEQTERVREMQLLEHLYVRVAADRGRGGRPFANPVKCKDQRPVERRGKEGARRMAKMMLAEA